MRAGAAVRRRELTQGPPRVCRGQGWCTSRYKFTSSDMMSRDSLSWEPDDEKLNFAETLGTARRECEEAGVLFFTVCTVKDVVLENHLTEIRPAVLRPISHPFSEIRAGGQYKPGALATEIDTDPVGPHR